MRGPSLRTWQPLQTTFFLLRRQPRLSAHSPLRQTRASSTASQTPQPSFLRRNLPPIIFSSLGLLLGGSGGLLVANAFAPPPLPEPNTHEDRVLMADLNQRLDSEFKVQVYRGKCLGVAKQLKGEGGDGWVEVISLPSVNEITNPETTSEKQSPAERQKEPGTLLSHLQGARGLGAERTFFSRADASLVSVIWLGGSLCGWPGNTHGGALATVLSEKLSLVNYLADSERADVLAAATPQRLPGTGNHAKMLLPANGSTSMEGPREFSLGYVSPAHANQFFVVRVSPAMKGGEGSGDGKGRMVPVSGVPGGKEFEASIETMDGSVCVKALAAFGPRKGGGKEMGLRAGVGNGKSSYEEFKEWMWPSRQKQSQIG